MTVFRNADGLEQAYGREQGVASTTGTVHMEGGLHKALVTLDFTDLPLAADGIARLDPLPVALFPKDIVIESATIKVDVAFTSGGAATLDLGLQEEDGTEIDNNGLFAAVTVASMNSVGDVVVGGGALINALTSERGVIVADVGTADFTAGRAAIEIVYRKTR